MTTTTFSAAGSGLETVAKQGDLITYSLAVEAEATFDATIKLLFSDNNGATWQHVATYDEAVEASLYADKDGLYKVFCDAFGEEGDDVTAAITPTRNPQVLWYLEAKGGVKPLVVKEDGIESPKATISSVVATSLTATGATVTTLTATSLTATSATIPALSLGNDILLLSGDGAPVDYTDGDPEATGEGTAGIGSIYVDYTNGKLYVNGGTKAEPLWKIVTSA